MLFASAVPVSVSVVALVMPSPTMPLSGENEAMVGATGAVVSMVTAMALEAELDIAGGIGGCRGQAVRAAGERRSRIAPGAAAVGRGAAEQGCAVIDLDR